LKNLGGSGQVQQLLVHAVTSIPLWVRASTLCVIACFLDGCRIKRGQMVQLHHWLGLCSQY
jgi:hypothetical protein